MLDVARPALIGDPFVSQSACDQPSQRYGNSTIRMAPTDFSLLRQEAILEAPLWYKVPTPTAILCTSKMPMPAAAAIAAAAAAAACRPTAAQPSLLATYCTTWRELMLPCV